MTDFTPSRRSFLTGLAVLIAAPTIVRASSLMPVKVMLPDGPLTLHVNPYSFADHESLNNVFRSIKEAADFIRRHHVRSSNIMLGEGIHQSQTIHMPEGEHVLTARNNCVTLHNIELHSLNKKHLLCAEDFGIMRLTGKTLLKRAAGKDNAMFEFRTTPVEGVENEKGPSLTLKGPATGVHTMGRVYTFADT